MSKALEERERMSANMPTVRQLNPNQDLENELKNIDIRYALAPSQKLLDQRLDVLVRMMVK